MRREELIQSITNTISSYEGGIEKLGLTIDENHVNRWLNQFNLDVNDELIFLEEFSHVLGKTYASEENIRNFLTYCLAENQNLTKNDPATFWSSAYILDIQKNGNSQRVMTKIFEEVLRSYNFSVSDDNANSENYIYLDDFIFTGNRMFTDLSDWVKNSAPQSANIHVIVIGLYTGSFYYEKKLRKEISISGKSIHLTIWRHKDFVLENRKRYFDNSHILCPISDYGINQFQNNFVARQPMTNNNSVFKSEIGRQMLERVFTESGVNILNRCQNYNPYTKPLGVGAFGFGFGAMLFTYRNCPNNTPLAIWWGNPNIYNRAM